MTEEEDVEDMTQVTYQPEERAHRYRQLSEQAIQQALNSQWDQAVETNRELLNDFPRDLSALNRLGKALSELGRYTDARQAYSDALEVDKDNTIAKKNLERLSQLKDAAESGSHHSVARIDTRLFIEETGKTGVTTLVDVAPRDVLAKLAPGDEVFLRPESPLLYVVNAAEKRIGRVEPRLANRLIRFMETKNRYVAGIYDLDDHEVRIIIREVFQSPENLGRVSFPATRGAGGEVIRPYIKDTILRHDVDEEEDEEAEFTEESDDEEGDDNVESDDFRETDFMDNER